MKSLRRARRGRPQRVNIFENDAIHILLSNLEAVEPTPPVDHLTKILMGVITVDGDVAVLRFALILKMFRDIVSEPQFREQTHFMWLDSHVNWNTFYRQQFWVLYSLTRCFHCGEIFKDCPHGNVGDGMRGVLCGFYSEKESGGCCSTDFFFK